MAQNIFIYLFDCNCIYAHFRRPHTRILQQQHPPKTTATFDGTAVGGWHLTSKALPRPDLPRPLPLTPPGYMANELVIDFT